MNKNLLTFTLLAVLLHSTVAESGFGACDSVTPQAVFDVESYLGVWYEIARFNYIFEDNAYCVTANYTLNTNLSGHVVVDNRERKGSVTGPKEQALGDAYAPDPSKPSELAVSFFGETLFTAPYWIVDTDYKTYSLVYSCTSVAGLYHFEYAWVLSRTPTLANSTTYELADELKGFGVPVQDFTFTVQEGCVYENTSSFRISYLVKLPKL